MNNIEIAQLAPDFCLPSDDGRELRLSDFKGNKILLYFYPKDATPGCTLQAKDLSKAISDFDAKKAVVIGVSKDSLLSHQKFRRKNDLKFILLSDIDGTVCAQYGVYKEKSMFGVKYMGIERSSFIIDENFMISKILRGVSPAGHCDLILKSL